MAAYLVPHDGLLDGGQVLQGRQQDVSPWRAADILNEVAKLLAQGNKHFVFIFNGLCVRVLEVAFECGTWEKELRTVEEGDEFLPSSLCAQGQGNGGEASNGIETEDNIVVLE